MTVEACTRKRRTCDCCGRPICRRCGRCFRKVPGRHGSLFRKECPSPWCRLAKKFRLFPLTKADTPRTGVCTHPEPESEPNGGRP